MPRNGMETSEFSTKKHSNRLEFAIAIAMLSSLSFCWRCFSATLSWTFLAASWFAVSLTLLYSAMCLLSFPLVAIGFCGVRLHRIRE